MVKNQLIWYIQESALWKKACSWKSWKGHSNFEDLELMNLNIGNFNYVRMLVCSYEHMGSYFYNMDLFIVILEVITW